MFEKEAEEMAEEYYYKTYPVTLNIGEEERKKEVTDIFLAGYNKANKWHYVKDGDLPKKGIMVLAYLKEDKSLVECLYIPDVGFKHPIFSEWFEPVVWIEKDKVLPKESE